MLWHYLFEIFEKQLRIHADLGAMTGWSLLNFSMSKKVFSFSAFCRFWLPFLVTASGCRLITAPAAMYPIPEIEGLGNWGIEGLRD
jgi:hypothetical protein